MGGTTPGHRRRLGDLGLHVRRRVLGGMPQGCRPGRRHPAGEGGEDDRHHAFDDAAVRGASVSSEEPRAAVGAEGRSRYPMYVPKVRLTWWLRSGPYRRFAAREITSMFAAIFSGMLMLFVFALSRGPGRYEGFLRWLKLPWVVAGSALVLVALLYHTATWFRSAATSS